MTAALRLALGALAVCLGPLFPVGCGGQPTEAKQPDGEQLTASPGVHLQRACTPTGPESCFDATDDNCNGIIDEGCGVHTGLVQFAIAWSDPDADVDLNVTDPNGELVDVGRLTKSGLVKERDCPGKGGECHGQNLENVYLEDGDPERGRYLIRVRLEKLGNQAPPVVVRFGARVGPKTYSAELELSRPEEERSLVLEL